MRSPTVTGPVTGARGRVPNRRQPRIEHRPRDDHNKASCLSLLSNAVVLWNTLQIEHIVTELRAGGTTIRDEDLVHVWPLQRRHITPNGVYFANRTMPAFVLPDPVEA